MTYQGFSNRETWATCTWIKSDDAIHTQMLSLNSSEELKFYIETLKDLSHDGNRFLQEMMDDIGSLWRIDWEQAYEACKSQQPIKEQA